MARPKAFDPQVSLLAAMEHFWRHGYEGTSLIDLTRCMGIQKASLYATWGCKRNLFKAALTAYQDHHFGLLEEQIASAVSVRSFLRETLMLWMREATSRDAARGCFCVNTAVELAPRDPEIAKMLTLHAHKVEQLIAKALEHAQEMGEVRTDWPAHVLARYIYTQVFGLSAVGKGCYSASKLEPVVDFAMAALDR